MSVLRMLGHVNRERGRNNEQRVLDALTARQERLAPWLGDVRLATPDEDARGIDIVVTTQDLGPLYLQVKSSRTGAERFHAKKRPALIATVVAHSDVDEDTLFRRAEQVLLTLRSQLRKMRER